MIDYKYRTGSAVRARIILKNTCFFSTDIFSAHEIFQQQEESCSALLSSLTVHKFHEGGMG